MNKNLTASIDVLNIKKIGKKRIIKWKINRNDFQEKIPEESLPKILPIDIFNKKKYKILKIYDINGNSYDGFVCDGFIEIELI